MYAMPHYGLNKSRFVALSNFTLIEYIMNKTWDSKTKSKEFTNFLVFSLYTVAVYVTF